MANLKKVIVFIPAYNEEKSIAQAIDTVRRLYPPEITAPKGYNVELVVVNDGSTDKTEEIVKSKAVTLLSHPRNLGLGAATRTAMTIAYEMGADVAIKLDADMQHDPADIEKVVMPVLEGKCDICWGSRFTGNITYKMPLMRLWGNRIFTWLMNLLTEYKISDAQTGMMAFNRKYLGIFELHSNYNPPQQLLLDANMKYMRYSEIPVVFHARTSGKSFVSLKYPIHVFVNIFLMLVYGNPLKVFVSIGLFFIFFAFFYFFLSMLAGHYGLRCPIFFLKNLSTISVLVGINSFFFGILADMINRKRRKW